MTDELATGDQAPVRARLTSIITDCRQYADQLEDLLDQEFDALEAQDADRLEQVAAGKQSVVSSLDGLESERRTLAAAAGCDADGAGMDKLLALCGADSTLADAWQTLLEVAGRCEQNNRRNGAISLMRREQMRSAIAVLSGTTESVPVYGPAGKEAGGAERRELARA